MVKVVSTTTEGIEINLSMEWVVNLIGGKLVIIPVPSTESLMVQKVLKTDIRIRVFRNKAVEGSR